MVYAFNRGVWRTQNVHLVSDALSFRLLDVKVKSHELQIGSNSNKAIDRILEEDSTPLIFSHRFTSDYDLTITPYIPLATCIAITVSILLKDLTLRFSNTPDNMSAESSIETAS